MKQESPLAPPQPIRLPALSRRERSIVELASQGKSQKEIAHELQISAGTVKVYSSRLLTKRRARSMTQVVAQQQRESLIEELSPIWMRLRMQVGDLKGKVPDSTHEQFQGTVVDLAAVMLRGFTDSPKAATAPIAREIGDTADLAVT